MTPDSGVPRGWWFWLRWRCARVCRAASSCRVVVQVAARALVAGADAGLGLDQVAQRASASITSTTDPFKRT